jgi:adenylosuccinate synthase
MNKGKVDVLLGLQWGDEGKGKVVDVLTPKYDVVARFQGGPNAGHSISFNGQMHVLHTVPSGIFREDVVNIIGNGVVVDPVILAEEIAAIEAQGKDVTHRLVISTRAHLILPTHRMLDAASEAAKGASKIGSTLKGIGPAYMDKTGRNGLRFGDLISGSFLEKYQALKKKHLGLLAQYPGFEFNVDEYEKKWLEAVQGLKRFKITDTEFLVNKYLQKDVAILAEGAQGSLLDVDFGSYPFVTSSNTMAAGVCTGLGIAPSRVNRVYGIFKAYCTRVGGGPFPTALFDETGEKLRQTGHEFGATTGRPRRCGWLDLVALKYAVMMNGVTDLIMMKSDVLDSFDTVKVATSYLVDGRSVNTYPYDGGVGATPVYTEFMGWKQDLTGIRDYESLPSAFKEYVAFIERETGCRISLISVSPDREDIIKR